MIPTAEDRALGKIEVDDMQSAPSSHFNLRSKNKATVTTRNVGDLPLSDEDRRSDKEWELKSVPAKPKIPYTPRTLAFNTLDRQLPLRAGEGRWN